MSLQIQNVRRVADEDAAVVAGDRRRPRKILDKHSARFEPAVAVLIGEQADLAQPLLVLLRIVAHLDDVQRPRSSNAIATGSTTSGSAATSSMRNPSATSKLLRASSGDFGGTRESRTASASFPAASSAVPGGTLTRAENATHECRDRPTKNSNQSVLHALNITPRNQHVADARATMHTVCGFLSSICAGIKTVYHSDD